MNGSARPGCSPAPPMHIAHVHMVQRFEMNKIVEAVMYILLRRQGRDVYIRELGLCADLDRSQCDLQGLFRDS